MTRLRLPAALRLACAAVLLAVCTADGRGAGGRVGVRASSDRAERARSRASSRAAPAARGAGQQTCAPAAGGGSRAERRERGLRTAWYLGRVSIAGAISCSATHSLVVPLDVIKTRMQTSADLTTARDAVRAILASGPGSGPLRASAFFTGLGATAAGYWLQGAAKFGGYEGLKHVAFNRLRALPDGDALCAAWRLPVMVGAAFGAEAVASALLCPLEVLKLRIQTDPTYAARGLLGALRLQVASDGFLSLFGGLSAICLRQLPYTAVKLVSYELFAPLLLTAALRTGLLGAEPRPDERRAGGASSAPRPLISLGAGMLAGAAAALASQPADVLLTRLCGSSAVSQLSACALASGWRQQLQYLASLGLRECYAGLGPRLAMVASMTSVQFLLYDQMRLLLGCAGPAPGAAVAGGGGAAGADGD